MKSKLAIVLLLLGASLVFAQNQPTKKLYGIELKIDTANKIFYSGNYAKSVKLYSKLIESGFETDLNYSMLGWSYYYLGFTQKAFSVFDNIRDKNQVTLPKSYLNQVPAFDLTLVYANKSPNKSFYTQVLNTHYKRIDFWLGTERFIAKTNHRSDFFGGIYYESQSWASKLSYHNYTGDIKYINSGYAFAGNFTKFMLLHSFKINPSLNGSYVKFQHSNAVNCAAEIDFGLYSWQLKTSLNYNMVKHEKIKTTLYDYDYNVFYPYEFKLGKNQNFVVSSFELSKWLTTWLQLSGLARFGKEDMLLYPNGVIVDDINTSHSHYQIKSKFYFDWLSFELAFKYNSNFGKTAFGSLNIKY